MKKSALSICSLVLAFIMLAAAIPFANTFGAVVANAATLQENGYKYTVKNGTATIVGYTDKLSGSITVPSKLGGVKVTSIGKEAFRYNEAITEVVIPETVTSIGDTAFSYCTSLKSVKLPSKLTSINSYVFANCTNLKSIVIPASVESIKYYAFQSSGITSVTISKNVKKIYDGAFSICRKLTAISVDAANKYYASVGGVLFNKAKTLLSAYPANKKGTYYTIPSTVTSIPSYAFEGNMNLTKVTVNSSVTTIGRMAFAFMNKLTTVAFASGSKLKTISDGVFFSSENLSTITLPATVQSVGINILGSTAYESNTKNHYDGVLYNNKCAIRVMKFKDSYKVKAGTLCLADQSFQMMNSKSLTLPNGLKYIGNNCISSPSLESIKIPSSVVKIGKYAFSYCSSLKSIVIPANVSSIGASPFYYCNSLASVTVDSNNKYYCVKGNILYNKKMTAIISSAAKGTAKNIVIPDSVTAIGESAFQCSDITSVFVPSSVTSVGLNIFYSLSKGFRVCVTRNSPAYKSAKEAGVSYTDFSVAPKLSSITNTTSGVKIKWNKRTYAAGYNIYRKVGSGSWSRIGTVKNTTFAFTDKTAKSGTAYTYTVMAYRGKTRSSYDKVGLTIKYLACPKISSAVSGKTGITLTFTKVSGAASYDVYRKTGSASWTKIGTAKGNAVTYIDKTAKKGTTYKYTIRAVSGSYRSYFYSGVSCKY